jgi:KDO2-lipid IV(A) lauroyltransferase
VSGSDARRSLISFWSPRYWPTWLLLGWMRLAALLPFRWNVRVHAFLGRIAAAVLLPRARIARRNLEVCFPELTSLQREDLLRKHLAAMTICLGETALAWFAPTQRVNALLHVEGLEHLHAALRNGNGAVLFTGHFTGIEVTGPLLRSLTGRLAIMFSRRRNLLLDEMQVRRRRRIAQASFPKDDVRALLRSLRRNAVVWYAADQFYRGNRAELVPFFHEPAMTNTAISRLARVSGAAVVPFFYRRRDDDTGYVLTFHPAISTFPTDDSVADSRRLVELLEAAIRKCPEQYWWGHKRFRDRPAPLPNLYAKPRRGTEPSSASRAAEVPTSE